MICQYPVLTAEQQHGNQTGLVDSSRIQLSMRLAAYTLTNTYSSGATNGTYVINMNECRDFSGRGQSLGELHAHGAIDLHHALWRIYQLRSPGTE